MGTLNEKLEYLSQTKEYIKEAIISKGQEVSSSDTFRSYASKISAIENGDVITVTNTTGSDVSVDDKVWVEPVKGNVENFTKVGTVAITDKVAQSLDSNNYISLSKIDFGNNAWEYQTAIYFTTITSGSKCVLSNPFQINVQFNSTSIFLLLSSNGTSWDINDVSNAANFQIPSQAKCYIKVIFDGSKYLLQTSENGSSWNTRITVNSSAKIFNSLEDIAIGKSSNVIDYLYLEDTYIKVNGNIVWTPYKEAVVGYSIINDTDITSTSFTAVAQTSIENNASGSVKTILDGNGSYAPTLGTKVITRNNTYSASTDDLYGYSSVTVNVEDIPAVVESLSITPTTSAQSFTPTSGVDGYSPVTVSAVDSSIDANITAGNIKSGVEILGVEGTYSGETPVLEDKVITSNGTYTAGQGYDGIGTATVAVNATGATEVATNRTGAAINAGDKVWVNQEYYEAGEAKFLNSDWPSYYTIVLPNSYGIITRNGTYRLLDNTVLGTTITTISRIIEEPDGTVYVFNASNSSSYLGMQRIDSGLGWTKAAYPVIGSSTFAVANYSSSYYDKVDKILEINNETGETISEFTSSTSYKWIHPVNGIAYIGNDTFLGCCSEINSTSSSHLCRITLDRSNNTWSSTMLFYLSGQIIGVTSDLKYLLASNNAIYKTDTLEDIYSQISFTMPLGAPFIGNGRYFDAKENVYQYHSVSTLSPDRTDSTYCVAKYDPATETWTKVSIDYDSIASNNIFNRICFSNGIPVTAVYGWSEGTNPYNNGAKILTQQLGNNLVPYTITTNETITGTAAESISAGATGNVYLGDKGTLQSKVALSNGRVTPDNGYYGLKDVTVNVVADGVEIEGRNYTGSTITAGDKVWINSEYYAAGEEINSNITNYADYLIGPITKNCFVDYGSSKILTYSGEQLSTIKSLTSSNASRLVLQHGDATYLSYYTGSIRGTKRIDSIFWDLENYYPIVGCDNYVYDSDFNIAKIDPNTGTIIEVYQRDSSLDSYYTNSHGFAAYLGDNKFIKLWQNPSSGGTQLVLVNVDFENKIVSGTSPTSYCYGTIVGVTSDYKYLMTGGNDNRYSMKDISDLSNISDVTSSAPAPFNLSPGYFTLKDYNCYNSVTDVYTRVVNFGYRSAIRERNVVTYDKTTKSFKNIEIDYEAIIGNSGYGVCGILYDGKNLVRISYLKDTSQLGGTYTYYSKPFELVVGNNLVNYNSITQDTQTGMATENIASGSTGTVKVGAFFEPVVETLNVTPTTSAQTITPGTGVDGYAPVTISAVDSTIDQNIIAGNIKKDVTILGVTGTLESANIQTLKTRTIESTDTLPVTIIPSSGYDGMAEVDIVAIENLSAENIKKDIEIAGVTGTYEGTVINNQDISITTDGVYTAEQEYTGLGTVTVTAGSVSEQKAYNEMAERLMLINDGEVTFTLTVSPTTASVILTSVTNSTDITPTGSSSGVYEYPISADSTKNYNYTVSAEGYTTQTGTVVGGTTTTTITLVAESTSSGGVDDPDSGEVDPDPVRDPSDSGEGYNDPFGDGSQM